LRTADGQGLLYGEAVAWPDLADQLRAHLWARLEINARSQALTRIWTGLESPFWKSLGFKKATPDILPLQPQVFANDQAAWLHLPMRTAQAADELDKQVAVLKALSQAETEQLLERARFMKWIAIGLITFVFGAFAVWVVYFVRVRSRLKKQPLRDL
jgi:hypothetical protein